MPDSNKFIRVEPDTHKLVEKVAGKVNKAKQYPTSVYNGTMVKIAVLEYVANHPELGVKA